MLEQLNDPSNDKILSTQNSRNSTFCVLPQQSSTKQNAYDSSFRLFTFMKQRNDGAQKKSTLNKQNNKKKSFSKASNKGMKRQNSILIDMIESSRKKRQHFLKLIINSSECVKPADDSRKCKTPTNLSLSNNKSITKLNVKNSITPRASINHQNGVINNKLGLTKYSKKNLKQLKCQKQNKQIEENQKKMNKKMGLNISKPSLKGGKHINQQILLKKKRQLQKKLVQINQTLLLGNQRRKTSRVQKIKK